ncbi:unnamed protein product [Clonostachys rosea]|uniref:Uncharacterized protein n=1 Tax=Bionectria ochroleuca TaxID=29856 RepID=A0ABY6UMV3_BIOOC|nr:unnamed protein product [Clonostachys rosea]
MEQTSIHDLPADLVKPSVKGKNTVITGGARGLGFAFAEILAGAGANIALLDVGAPKEGSVEALESNTGAKIRYYKTDVTSREQVNQTIEAIEKEFGSVDININAAGVVTDESFLTTSDKNLSTTFNVNENTFNNSSQFVGSFLVSQACANAMVRKWEKLGKPKPAEAAPTGHIIFIGSVSTHISTYVQQTSCYVASKAAVGGLVKPLAMELSQYGIRVNILSPGSMRTDMFLQVEKTFPDLTKQFNQEHFFGRVGFPHELGPAIIYLSTSTWTTGQDIVVDGGVSGWKHRGNW